MKSSKTRNALAAGLAVLAFAAPAQAGSRQSAVVESVLSGDTVRLRGGKELRYIGLESPPVQSSIALLQEYGQAALAFNRSLTEGRTVDIEWGPQLRDSKNRLLGYVFLPDGTFVNRSVLQNGHAKLKTAPPNTRYADDFRQDELAARRAKKGLWVKEPDDPRLKVDILGDKVTRTYFYPNSPELDRVPEAQLVHFRSRVEAKAAGYKPCSSCRTPGAGGEAESP